MRPCRFLGSQPTIVRGPRRCFWQLAAGFLPPLYESCMSSRNATAPVARPLCGCVAPGIFGPAATALPCRSTARATMGEAGSGCLSCRSADKIAVDTCDPARRKCVTAPRFIASQSAKSSQAGSRVRAERGVHLLDGRHDSAPRRRLQEGVARKDLRLRINWTHGRGCLEHAKGYRRQRRRALHGDQKYRQWRWFGQRISIFRSCEEASVSRAS